MPKLQFKRKKSGGGADYGAGWDHMLKDFYDDLDKITEDNYFFRHNVSLINKVLNSLSDVLEFQAIPKMLELKEKSTTKVGRKNCQEWTEKATTIKDFFKKAKTNSQKVIAIDGLTQFLRETSTREKRIKKLGAKKKVASKKIKLITGKPTNLGLARGKVKIILGYEKDFSKMKKGDILVTDETDPTFLPIMFKAKAIITDTGGLLCHGAIASRELKIPCVVGTRIATRVLKTGDMVEVDADKGVVRIIKKT